ncbi:MAG: ABC transporter ATP-binding protein [Polyangia bacterium]
MEAPKPILSIRDLAVEAGEADRRVVVPDGLSLDVKRGSTTALLGESGSGKTLTALAVLGLLPSGTRVLRGSVRLFDTDLLRLDEERLRRLRGERVGMVFQEPTTSLNPLMQIGKQIAEPLRVHKGLDKKISHQQTLALMEMVGIPDPRRRYRHYPHQLSGGVRQRVVIAMALACRPELLLADEPTSALDATIQAQIVDLLARLIRDLRMSVLLITHDLGVINALADDVEILHGGRIVERGPVDALLKQPAHPYTRAILRLHPTERLPAKRGGLAALASSPPASQLEEGCALAGSCPEAEPRCRKQDPGWFVVEAGHRVRCFAAGSESIDG